MHTDTIFSEKSAAKTGLYVKEDFKTVTNKYGKNNIEKKEKAVVRDIFRSEINKKSISGKFSYTIQHGDDKRLSRNGVLRVYNINEPVEIPVGELLGKWKKSHVGVTLVVLNQEWHIEGEVAEDAVNKAKPSKFSMFF